MNLNKILFYLSIIVIISPVFNDKTLSQNENIWWNEEWTYREEINIPIDTSKANSNFQPIDVRIIPNNPCWIKDEINHSIRVCYWNGVNWKELESQIYNIEKNSENNAISFNLVFLIPEFANGEEKYFVYYDENQKTPIDYIDHVDIKINHYFYEPIPDQSVNLDYYEIIDDSKIIYGIGINGKMMTEYGSNLIFRQKKDCMEFDIKNWDQLIGFCFQYDDSQGNVITTRYKTLSNEVIIDGNLMVEFGIESVNEDETIKTTNIYKYYHSPIESKRICINSKSHTIKNIIIDKDIERDGTYVFLSAFKTISETNEVLNFGEILPYYHVYSEENIIKEFNVNTNPTSRDEHKIISINDDVDLGDNAWFSTDEGNIGKAIAIIFSKNIEIIENGEDERDGIQVKAYEKEEVSLPGLKAYSAGIYCGRNSYEKQDSIDLDIPSDFTISFQGELFTTEKMGYESINQEAIFFKQLVKQRPETEKQLQDEMEEIKTYNLKVIVPFSISLPLISPISPIPLPITWVEITQNNSVISAGAVSRSIEGLKVEFPELKEGEYIIKIYKKRGKNSKFFAYKLIEIKEDKKIIIFPKRQLSLSIQVFDQNKNEIRDVKAELRDNGHIIIENITDDNGLTILKIPKSNNYQLKLYYKNIPVFSEEIKLRISKKSEYNIELKDLKLKIFDKLGMIPGVELNPILTTLNNKILISNDYNNNNEFIFTNLPKSTFRIRIIYENVVDEITHIFPDKGEIINIEFSAEFPLNVIVYDSRGNILSDKKTVLTRENKIFNQKTTEKGELFFNIPPGIYNLKIFDENTIIREKNILILRENNLYLTTDEEPIYPLIITISSIIFLIIGILLFLIKRIKISLLLKFLIISLLAISLIQPWWVLNGESNDNSIKRMDINYLLPQIIVTKTIFEEDIISEPSNIPSEFSDFLFILVIMIIFSIFLTALSMVIKKYKKIFLILSIITLIILILVIGIYYYAFSELTNVGLGGIQGSDSLLILNPLLNENIEINAVWGVSFGVLICIFSIIVYIFTIFLLIKYDLAHHQ